MKKKTLKRVPYLKKYGIEKYWMRSRGRKPSPAEVKKVRAEIPGVVKGIPKEVGVQPKGLKHFAEDVEICRIKYGESYTKAKKRAYESEYWERRRRYASYSPKVQRYIRDMYAEAKAENRLKKVRGPDGEFISTES